MLSSARDADCSCHVVISNSCVVAVFSHLLYTVVLRPVPVYFVDNSANSLVLVRMFHAAFNHGWILYMLPHHCQCIQLPDKIHLMTVSVFSLTCGTDAEGC